MPNDPRVKFRTPGKVCDKDIDYLRKHPEYLRDHPECRIVFSQHYAGGGGSSGRLRSIFEDGTPPPDRPTDTGGGETGGGGGATDIVPASLPVKPGLDPGGIAGITIASAIAMGAAAALAEHERRRRMNRGLPVPQDNIQMTNTRSRPNLNRGGTRVPSSSRSSSSSVAAGGLVPSTSGSDSSRSSSGSNSASISRSTSGSSTPTSYESASSRSILTSVNPDIRGRGQLGDIRISAPGIQTPAPTAIPYYDARTPGTFNRPPEIELTNLEQQLVQKQSESQNPNISEGRSKKIQSEIRVLEREIESIRAAMQTRLPQPPAPAPAPAAVLDDIRAAMQTSLPAAVPAPEIQGIRDAMGTRIPSPPLPPDIPSPPSEISTKTATPGSPEEMIFRLEEAEAVIIKRLANPSISSTERKQLIQRLDSVQSQQKYYNAVARKNLISEAVSGISTQVRYDPYTGRVLPTDEAVSRISRNINPSPPSGNIPANDAFNAARQTGIELQDIQAHAQQTQSTAQATAEAMLADIDTLQADRAAIVEIDRVRTPGGARTPMVEFEVEIQELLKEARATRGSRLFERAMAGVNERIQRSKATLSDLQKMGSRNKIQPTAEGLATSSRTGSGSKTPESGRATLERARAAGRPMPQPETEMRGSSLSAKAAASGAAKPEIQGIRDAINTPGPAPKLPPPPLSDAEALEQGIKQSRLEAGLGYTKGGESSKGVTAEILRAEQPSNRPFQPQEPVQGPRTRQGKETVSSEPLPRDWVAPRAKAPVERIVLGAPPPPAPAERPPPRQPRPQEDFGEELGEGVKYRNRPLDKFNEYYDTMTERWRAYYSDSIPTAPKGMTEIQGKKYVMEQILKEQAANGDPITRGDKNPIKITLEQALDAVQTLYDRTDPPVSEEISTSGEAKTKKSLKPDRKRKLTKQTELLATEEQRLRPTALAGEAQARVQARAAAPAEARAAAPAPEARAAAPEARAAAPEVSARSVPAPPEVTARRRLGVPELTAPPPAAPTETASFAERRAFFEETSKVKPPIGEPTPSAPPSAPGSGTATPSEGATMEQTPTERAALAEELTGRLSTKKGPSRQKAKMNIGKPKTTANPLDIFVSPQHRNLPNTELKPSAKGLKGALTEISARVPRLVPTRSTLISMGAEGGSMVGGFAAGYFSAQAMNDYFAKNPPKNLGEQYGQALATTFVGMAVGSITQVVLSQVIRQGVNYALTGEMAAMEGAISGGGTLFLSSIGEAAIFTAVGVTTQMATTKFLEDAGFNHAVSRSAGALASTYALAGTEVGLWIAKGGPLNPAGDVSFLASEAMIIGFGIYSFVTEFFEGQKQDEEEEEYQAQLAENQRLNEERQRTIDNTIKRNGARESFMHAYERADYDFDKALALLTPEQRIDLGQNAAATDPNGLVAFRAQVEGAFDPLLDTTLPEGYKPDPTPLSRENQLKRDTYTAYVNWYVDSMNGKNPPPFNFDSEGAKLLNDESGGTWTSAANVHATTSITMARRTNPLIEKAQREIVDAFHKDHKTIEDMPLDTVQYADLDPSFRERYNYYIIAEAQSYIYQQYNNGGFRYDSMDSALVAIANRDPEFRGAVDTYYQVLANQARDYNMTIQDAARLNAMAIPDQQREIGKLNEARNKIIQEHQAANQEQVDRYNASVIQEISAYGDNFEAIIRNINDQALLTGHTFLYAATPADLYRQLHMEMPEIELVDPDTDTGEGGTDAPLPGPSKGRKIGDTDLYGYRYKLTDEQNQELDELARVGVFSKDPIAMQAEAERIRYRDRYLFEDTDAEKAARENLTLDEYYKKYGIVAEQPIIEWEARLGKPKEDGKYRYPDGTIETWKNGFKVDVDTSNAVSPITLIPYDPTLSSQPDGMIEMPDGALRTYKNGLVIQVQYPANTHPAEALTPDQINERERPTTPTEAGPSYTQLQQMYPDTYNKLLRKYGEDNVQIEATLRKAYTSGFNETTGETSSGLTPGGQPVEPITPTEPTRQPTYDELKLMYPDELATFQAEYSRNPRNDPSYLEPKSQQFLMQQYKQNPRPLPATTPTTPTTPTDPAMLKQGDITMPDGSFRTYKNGKVIYVSYPPNITASGKAKFAEEINEEEGIRASTWTPEAPVVTPVEPVVDRNTLLQGRVTWSDRSTRTYIDGKVVSVQYPDGKTGPNINEINAAEGVQPAKDPGARPKDWMDRFLEEQAQQLKAKNDADAAAAAAAAAENPEPDTYVNPRGFHPTQTTTSQTTAPAPAPAPAQAPVAPTPAPGQTKGPKPAALDAAAEYRASKVEAQNAQNQAQANNA